MKFDQAVRSVFSKYATFSGRASRSEYWWWTLFYWIGLFIILAFTKLYPIWEFGLFIPNLAVGVRRMHDSNHSGWWIICPIVNIVLLFFPSIGPNRFDAGAPHPGDRRTPPGVDDVGVRRVRQIAPSPVQNFCQGCGAKFD